MVTDQNMLDAIFREESTNLGIFVEEGVLVPWAWRNVSCHEGISLVRILLISVSYRYRHC
jgi:hypothetical protein